MKSSRHLNISRKPKPHSSDAATSSVGTCRSCSRAITDSTTPIATAIAEHFDHERAPSPPPPSRVWNWRQHMKHNRRQHEELHRRAVKDHAQERPAVIEHHHFVNHRQFEMRVGIVDRDAAVFGQQHDEQPGRRPAPAMRSEAHAEATVSGERSIGVRLNDPDSLASTRNARNSAGSEKQANVTSRAAPIPSKDEPVSSAADVVKNRAKPEQIREQNQIAGESDGRMQTAQAEQAIRRSEPPPASPAAPARNTHVVVVLKTIPLRISRARS